MPKLGPDRARTAPAGIFVDPAPLADLEGWIGSDRVNQPVGSPTSLNYLCCLFKVGGSRKRLPVRELTAKRL